MSLNSILQIANRLFNESAQQNSSATQASNTLRQAGQKKDGTNGPDGGERRDRFVPSQANNTANEAGLFQVTQLQFTAVNVESSAGSAVPAAANAATAAAPAAAAPAAPALAVAATPAPAAVATVTPAPASTPAATTATPAQSQNALQTLNSSLQ